MIENYTNIPEEHRGCIKDIDFYIKYGATYHFWFGHFEDMASLWVQTFLPQEDPQTVIKALRSADYHFGASQEASERIAQQYLPQLCEALVNHPDMRNDRMYEVGLETIEYKVDEYIAHKVLPGPDAIPLEEWGWRLGEHTESMEENDHILEVWAEMSR